MTVKLNEYDKVEWRDVALRLRPDWTEEDFERAWAVFLALQASHRVVKQ